MTSRVFLSLRALVYTCMVEVWNPIPGYEGLYEASSQGRIKSLSRYVRCAHGAHRLIKGRIRKPVRQRNGYLGVILSRPTSGRPSYSRHLVHRLVISAFYGVSSFLVNHIDCDKTNNVLSNLEYVTHKQNMNHAVLNGRIRHGEDHQWSKLTREQVVEIREIGSSLPQAAIARRFGVTRPHISYILNNKTWRA